MNRKSPNKATLLTIAFIQARWHAEIVDRCRLAFIEEIGRLTAGPGVSPGLLTPLGKAQRALAGLSVDALSPPVGTSTPPPENEPRLPAGQMNI